MIKYRVVLVPFPFDDLSSAKLRPAVCLTEPIGPHRHVVVAFITSRTPSDSHETDIVLDSSDADFAATGLRRSSVVRLHRLTTIASSVIRRDLGTLSGRMQSEVVEKLRNLFELT